MDDDCNSFFCDVPVLVFLSGMGLAVFVLTIYHCVVPELSRHHAQSPVLQHSNQPDSEGTISTENSRVQLIPSHNYQKGIGLMGEDSTCAVCLCEFQEGDQIRTLPECKHSYHAPCIDMWLYSHPNCPLCRTNTPQPPPQIFSQVADYDSIRLDSGMQQNMIIHSRTL